MTPQMSQEISLFHLPPTTLRYIPGQRTAWGTTFHWVSSKCTARRPTRGPSHSLQAANQHCLAASQVLSLLHLPPSSLTHVPEQHCALAAWLPHRSFHCSRGQARARALLVTMNGCANLDVPTSWLLSLLFAWPPAQL